MENIVSITNPADPFLERPEIGQKLRAQLPGPELHAERRRRAS